MKLLAIDCATSACSAALWLDEGPGPRRHAVMQRGHAEALMPMIQAVMRDADLAYADLSAIAVTVGPGAFTGLRIGLSAARGLAVATGRPLIGVTTLEAIAAAQDAGHRPMLVALESKRADIYVQLFAADGTALGEPESRLPSDVSALLPAQGELVLAGDAADVVAAALAGRDPAPVRLAGPDLPDAAVVARIAVERLRSGASGAGVRSLDPLYLRAPDAITAAARRAGQPA